MRKFSSPSGDGLVRTIVLKQIIRSKYFRPRLGMGWFFRGDYWFLSNFYFRPRVGMGWFTMTEKGLKIEPGEIFVPAWGWVGSWQKEILLRVLLSSSPSGDGLVPAGTDYNTQIRTIFVPTWRWVNFLISCATRLALLCSSPGWDGVIPKRKSLKPMKHTVFVPEWGWVGS